MSRKYTSEQCDEIEELYISGLGCREVSEKTGIPVPSIKSILNRRKTKMRPGGFQKGNPGRTGKPHSEVTKDKIRQKHLINGHAPSLQAAAIGQPKTLVVRWGNHIRDPMKFFMISYQTGAIRRGLDFTLTREEFEALVSKPCFYCGRPPHIRYVARDLPLTCNGIDRIDSSLGYSPGNCRTACKICNVMKSSHTVQFYIEHCKAVAKEWEGKEI